MNDAISEKDRRPSSKMNVGHLSIDFAEYLAIGGYASS